MSGRNLLADLGMKYFFTSYGVVYAGFEVDIPNDYNRIGIIQNNHLKEYIDLPPEQRTIDKFQQIGHVIPKNVVVGWVRYGDKIREQNHDVGVRLSQQSVRKDMFLFGAGASANCIMADMADDFKKSTLRPPLGNDLFALHFRDIYKNYEGVRESITELRDKGINVEEFFENEWQQVEMGNVTVMNRHINIQYYLQEILTKVSEHVCDEYFDSCLYSKLALKLQRLHFTDSNRHFAMVSFNQDTILEYFFARQFKVNITSMNDYVQVNEWPFSIFKPHGSVNWGWKFPMKIENASKWLHQKNTSFHELYYETLGKPENMIDWHSYGLESIIHDHNIGKFTIDKSRIEIIPNNNTKQYYPALLLPYRDKDEFTFPYKHYNCLNAYLPHIENLYIIGWKGNERAFNKLLSTKATKIKRIVIADPNFDEVEANMRKIIKGADIQVLHFNGFEDFVNNFEIT